MQRVEYGGRNEGKTMKNALAFLKWATNGEKGNETVLILNDKIVTVTITEIKER